MKLYYRAQEVGEATCCQETSDGQTKKARAMEDMGSGLYRALLRMKVQIDFLGTIKQSFKKSVLLIIMERGIIGKMKERKTAFMESLWETKQFRLGTIKIQKFL